MLGFDPMYMLFVLPAMLLAGLAQMRVHSAFSRFSQVPNSRGISGAEAARIVMENNGIHDVSIEPSHGRLSDHYDPGHKVLRLSPEVYGNRTIAAIGVAAHEAGHAIQHARGYAPLHIRSALVPVAGYGSWLSWPLIALGFMLNSMNLVVLGIVAFSAIVLFQIVTLPVEFDASSRAKVALRDAGLVTSAEEEAGVSSVLGAAALTYVAATLTALLQLAYYLWRAGLLGGSREDR